MGLINHIFRWFITDRTRQVDYFNQWPLEVQEKVFRENLSMGIGTKYGDKYNFEDIHSITDYKEAVPLNDYNSLKGLIEEMMLGESNILWKGSTKWFAKSSGTTQDKSKFIPVSNESLQDTHFKAGKDLYAMYYELNEEANLVDGKTLGIGGSHQIHKLNNSCFFGDLSAVLLQNIPTWAEQIRVPNLSIALMDNWEEKVEKMAISVAKENVTNILGVPTWTVVLIRKIFEITGKSNIADVWPNLELYIHGGVSFSPYKELFKSLIDSPKMHYLETYNASEGFFAIQDNQERDDMLLMLDYGIFYEFIPLEDFFEGKMNIIGLEEVKENHNYVIIISTNGGLWRYQIGDTVKFTSIFPFRIKITGRTTHYINAFGEELIVENADMALSYACQKTNAQIIDYTGCPVFFDKEGAGAHEWAFEFSKQPNNLSVFIEFFDEKLKELNSDYEAKRFKNMALEFPKFHQVKEGTFHKWLKIRNKLGGQHKIPRLSNERIYLEEILKIDSQL